MGRSMPSWQTNRTLKGLQPAPPRPPQPLPLPTPNYGTSFLDLPAELRIAIYELVLKSVIIHILPPTSTDRHSPLSLLCTSQQIRSEVRPIILKDCPIRATITDFDFTGLLTWLSRIPNEGHKVLATNKNLSIRLCTTLKVPGDLPSLRRWLHQRADKCRPQPDWRYSGPQPSSKVGNELRRRVKRMKNEPGKQSELAKMVKAVGVTMFD